MQCRHLHTRAWWLSLTLHSCALQVRTTCAQAVRCWWSDNHEGWMIFTLGNRHFQTLEEIIQYSQSEGAAVAGPPHPSAPEPSHHPYQVGLPTLLWSGWVM